MPESGVRRGRRPLLRGLLVFTAMLAPLVLAEGACRVHAWWRGNTGPGAFLAPDSALGWQNRAGFVGRHVAQDFDVEIRIDARACRVGAGESSAADDAPVVAVGDSTTFGWGVDAASIWPRRLAERLEVEIANLGVSGYGPGQQWLLLRREFAAGRRPRVVIVTHTPNDLHEVLRSYGYDSYKPRVVARGGELEVTGLPLPFDLARASYLWRTIRKRFGGGARSAGGADGLAAVGTVADATRALVERIYRAMHELSRRHGARMVLAGLDAAWLRAAAERIGVPYVELRPAMDRVEGSFRFASDPHWIAAAHGEVAAEFEAVIESALRKR